jgi:hypothetical protein
MEAFKTFHDKGVVLNSVLLFGWIGSSFHNDYN